MPNGSTRFAVGVSSQVLFDFSGEERYPGGGASNKNRRPLEREPGPDVRAVPSRS